MILEFDNYVQGIPYPNMARHKAVPFTPGWREFSHHWPFSEPPALLGYCNDEGIELNFEPRCYLIAVSFFDFGIKWFDIIPKHRIEQILSGQLKLVFFYSEGDNPVNIQKHLIAQCQEHGICESSLWLISANSSADELSNSSWFADDELLFRKRNRKISPCAYHENPRHHLFTALVRTHKWWRATVMADFWQRGWHHQGFFSYNSNITVGEHEHDNPIEIDLFDGLRSATYKFLKNCPFHTDNLTSDQHNDHHLCVPEHYTDSYLNVVVETHMDVDQSNGVFLTEKTFKPIKHAQPFVIFGAAGSLKKLRDLGYRTFQGIIDDRYDSITNTTDRYACLIDILNQMFSKGHAHLHGVYCECKQDLIYNQQHFLASKQERLNTLIRKITCK